MPFNYSAFLSYTCHICHLPFVNLVDLQAHLSSHVTRTPARTATLTSFGIPSGNPQINSGDPIASLPSGETPLKKTSSDEKKVEIPQAKRKGPFNCHICNKRIPYLNALRRHKLEEHNIAHSPVRGPQKYKRHPNETDDGRFQCPECDEFFYHTSHLYVHQRKRHGHPLPAKRLPRCKTGPYQCPLCPVKLTSINSLNRHLQLLHKS